jgi:DNA polymerase-3 subunit gamma/tau
LVGQEPIARTLRQAIQRQQVAHAYLFCGPRGTGKTSAARIFARAVNCLAGLQGEPCNRCVNCTSMLDGRQLDLLVEIDAASNRGVEDARTLRDRLLQRPGGEGLTGRYKVYIIDEVHMLTKEAFNTLLKSLEEPPPHVIFILATTDPQEVLPTILSRCQRFDFRSIPLGQLVAHLARVAGEEGVAVETRALETIARSARGGLRDAIGLLDQAFAYVGAGGTDGARQVSANQVDSMLGLSRADAIAEVLRAIGDADLGAVLRATHSALEGGADVRAFSRQVVEALRAILLAIGGAPEVIDLDPGFRDFVALHARRFTLGRTIRAIKALAAIDSALRTRAADATLLFEVAVAEIVAEAAGTMTATAPQAPSSVAPSPTGSGSRARDVVRAPFDASPAEAAPPVAPVRGDEQSTAAPVGVRIHGPQVIGDEHARGSAPTNVLANEAGGADNPVTKHDDTGFALRPSSGPADPRSSVIAAQDVAALPVAGAPVPTPDTASSDTWPTPGAPARAAGSEKPARRRGPIGAHVDFTEASARWGAVIERVGGDGMAPLVGLLQGSTPSGVDPDGTIAVACGSTFFVQKLREPANQVGIERCASQVLGVPVRLRFHVAGSLADAATRRSTSSGAQAAFVARAARMLGGRTLAPEEVEQLDRQAPLPLGGLPD